ncbi:unnamed protein product [Arctia plantaginis]|uniref:VWFC domain-containing protein n=1 Tax=Arctia plantaginis TaxID=874455 RepID=A0A8S1AZD5_ARCPL|nr:unnamed protein product [Arctia plantaginis]
MYGSVAPAQLRPVSALSCAAVTARRHSMASALFALIALLACVCTDSYEYRKKDSASKDKYSSSNARNFDQASLLSGCLYEGRWHSSGAVVETREKCLHCVCVRSALSCRRQACAPLIDPTPKRCHIRHRREACCPELVCPDGVVNMEKSTKTRFERDDFEDAIPVTVGLACVEGGTIYAAGSAMSSNVACEQCFCLKGSKKCVRPNCLPPPPHCVPRPTPGACCPQRYYCEYDSDVVEGHTYDCEVEGKRIQEGERVFSGLDCTACFCLKGTVQCQEMGCAPPLHGCQPILTPGDCCAHQYKCDHNPLYRGQMYHHRPISYNYITASRNDDRSLHIQKWSKSSETNTEKIFPNLYKSKNMPIGSVTTNDLEYTVKVKRKTDEADNEYLNNDTDDLQSTTSQKSVTVAAEAGATEIATEENTEHPEGIVKIVINGTINCTAELSSTSLPLSIGLNDTDRNQAKILPRIPIVNGIEAQAYAPNDIITDRSVLDEFDENDTFTINVTSSLNGNRKSTVRPERINAAKKPIPVALTDTLNNSKKAEDYDYDYNEPTLPPSLPNLKIIPFVAADAVVDDELSKDVHEYPSLDREDKYPVYYPAKPKVSSLKRDETYDPTQYPVFVSDKDYDLDLPGDSYNSKNKNEETEVTKAPSSKLETPAFNLFSPPIETEGGFIPKGPGINDEYFTVYTPSTPSAVAVPHLTTSMQLDIPKGDCVTEDGKHIPEGGNITMDCNECVCEWGRLRCAPTLCRAPRGCHFKEPDPDSVNQCCGDLICKKENKTTTALPAPGSTKVENTNVEIAVKGEKSDILNQPSQLNNTTSQNNSLSTPINTAKKQTFDKTTEKPNKTSPTRTTSLIGNHTTITLSTNGSALNTTVSPETTHVTKMSTIIPPTNTQETNDTSSEYEDDEDMGFSFGSVLKLLLSENYESTTSAPYKKPTSTKAPVKSSPPPITSTKKPPSTVNPFIPLPSLPFNPPKIVPSTISRIDHLVLGEATAIKRTTLRPITNKTTKKPTERTTEKPKIDIFTPGLKPPSLSGSTGPTSQGVGAGLLKLAGCNIYGRIYRVGRIIAELSTPCLECWCVEIGVECKKLEC